MLTTDQVDHFRAFGFIVLGGYLADRIGVLCAEADAAIRDAYATTYHERVIDGISGHYLPMASRLTPVSASLACDDPRFSGAAEQLLGGPVIPECPEGVVYGRALREWAAFPVAEPVEWRALLAEARGFAGG